MMRLVLQLAAILISAKIVGYLFEKHLKQPRVLGELASGMIIGPFALGRLSVGFLHGPLFPVADGTLPISPELYGFAVVASIVLLFLSGLETDLSTFLRFSVAGSLVGTGGVAVSFLAGTVTAFLLVPEVDGLLHPEALFLGVLATATSVGITARILSEKRKLSSPEGVTILSAAVLDDVLGIVLLAVVVGIGRSAGTPNWGEIGLIAAKALGFWIGCTVLGIFLAPRFIRSMKAFRSLDVIVGVSFGVALLLAGLAESAGLALIIGAYVAGLALSQTDIAHELRERMQGLYDFLVPIFFCVMGMLVDFSALSGIALFGVAYTGGAIIGKLVGCGIPALGAGFNLRGAFRIGCGMLPRGEVTLIMAGIGLAAGIIGPELFGVAVITLLVSSVVAPPLLISSFQGGSGRKKTDHAGADDGTVTIRLELPNSHAVEFLRERIEQAFRQEEFFVNRVDVMNRIYHARKDEVHITIVQTETEIVLSTPPKNEQFVRLLLVEEILALQELLTGLESSQSPDRMGRQLLNGLMSDS
jgi:Kef-type K+ transport system membrane component KefB